MQQPPQRRIFTENDLHLWCTSKAYTGLTAFIVELNEAVVDKSMDLDSTGKSELDSESDSPINNLLSLIQTTDSWIDDITPVDSPQRFGNTAFRDWGRRLEENAAQMLTPLLPNNNHTDALNQITPTLLNAFGSFVRIDYGTGHELSFIVVLYMLRQIGVLNSTHNYELIAKVFVNYWKTVTRLQITYKLEPAGSHGVWGLDDYCFMPYIFGSAQIRSTDTPPSRLFHQTDAFPDTHTNLYARAVSNIHQFKSGPWHEHSPQLYSIAHTVPNWFKVNKGLFKMFDAEVLKKRVVVQHLLFSYLFPFDSDPAAQQIDHGGLPLSSGSGTGTSTGISTARLQHQQNHQTHNPTPRSPHSDTLLPPLLSRNERKKQKDTLASSGSAAASTSPFGVLSKPS
ncbi:hypothetical protein E3P89_00999 [Wallemia ichthyophaga]|uniref:Serine/threonine-protein phosphatase 2A activator n=1 Tax=Wallemia ichthyophaga TaxID=245174 RepID=A0A4T0IH74_WALIC|nr:hypothetical protein E3P91_01251 [Wallemia ichthyophaga]TIA92232.1 hypothetical protein E3P97_01560 [Wallemia ichthyophaga]TIB06631.1 hypothetical protein E3P96_00237 [Wallemia ichthyophaga]TIB14348.1 hypothetical protein E3P90_01294 [Wallemia ichthyophaga]TIB16181.1 hypothetical protein E3P93_01045 [Wallemia ichthyophaga]